ncbi:MAG: monovalent cation/H+ antiporter complex subunit F [Planctomycetota bacterium]|nr:monovalent cation/H+ antiporter complex subunit F [Planctomycetota bacterium]
MELSLLRTDIPALVGGVALLIGISLVLVRAVAGPTAYDRILAMNAIGTKAALLIAMLGFITQRPDFLDIALAYAILNFLGTIAILKFIRHRRLG